MRALYLLMISVASVIGIQVRQCNNPSPICSDVAPNVNMPCGIGAVTVTVHEDSSCSAKYTGSVPALPGAATPAPTNATNAAPGTTSAPASDLKTLQQNPCDPTNSTDSSLYVVCDAIPATAVSVETTIAQYASKGQGTTLPLALAIPLGCAVSVNTLYGLQLKSI